MVWRSILLSVTQSNCCLAAESNLEENIQRLTQKYRTQWKVWNQKSLLLFWSWKKWVFLRNLTKISNLILCFSEIPKVVICVCVRQVTFLSGDWKKLSVWSSVFFTVSALVIHEREYRGDHTYLPFSKRSPF